MKVLFTILLFHATCSFVFTDQSAHPPNKQSGKPRSQRFLKPVPRRTALAKTLPLPKPDQNRKLYLDDLNQSYGSYTNGLMDNTNTNVYEMQSHNRRNAQLRQIGTWFGDVDLSVDDFRDTVSQKLDQLNMSLQKPKIPVPGFGAAMTLPYSAINPSMMYGTNMVRGITPGNQPYASTVIQQNPLANSQGSVSQEPEQSNNSENGKSEEERK